MSSRDFRTGIVSAEGSILSQDIAGRGGRQSNMEQFLLQPTPRKLITGDIFELQHIYLIVSILYIIVDMTLIALQLLQKQNCFLQQLTVLSKIKSNLAI